MEYVKVTAGHKKAKKKPVKDEFDRMKQAEKKKRRLEKALATSAAIRSELEKKKLQKKQEQERLEEQGAAIAEAVALHVLHGEDSDGSSNLLLKQNESWDFASNMNIILAARHPLGHYSDLSKYSSDNIEQLSRPHQYGHFWNGWENFDLIGSSYHLESGSYAPYFGDECCGTVYISAGHLAAQALSSSRLAEDARIEAYAFNGFLRG